MLRRMVSQGKNWDPEKPNLARRLVAVMRSLPIQSSPESGAANTSQEAKQRGFAASARAQQGNKLAGRNLYRNIIERVCVDRPGYPARESVCSPPPRGSEEPSFSGAHHLMTPFCQTNTRSRSLKSIVMIVEKKAAMMISAA